MSGKRPDPPCWPHVPSKNASDSIDAARGAEQILYLASRQPVVSHPDEDRVPPSAEFGAEAVRTDTLDPSETRFARHQNAEIIMTRTSDLRRLDPEDLSFKDQTRPSPSDRVAVRDVKPENIEEERINENTDEGGTDSMVDIVEGQDPANLSFKDQTRNAELRRCTPRRKGGSAAAEEETQIHSLLPSPGYHEEMVAPPTPLVFDVENMEPIAAAAAPSPLKRVTTMCCAAIVMTVALVAVIVGVYFGTQGKSNNGSPEPAVPQRTIKVFESTEELYTAVDLYALGNKNSTLEYGDTIGDWDVSRIQVFDRVFDGSRWTVFNDENFCQGWSDCLQMKINEDLSGWNMSGATSTVAMFSNAIIFNGDLSGWDVSRVTNMSHMFNFAESFNRDISTWKVGSVLSTNSMFLMALSFNQPLDKWNMSSVVTAAGMFGFAESFNQPLASWDVSAVHTMGGMFRSAKSFNHSIASWDVSSVTRMLGMLNNAHSFNFPLADWNVSLVTSMSQMFYRARSFNQPLNDWDVRSVLQMDLMFGSADSFNQKLNAWNVSSVTSMYSMFGSAQLFNQPLGAWDVSSVKSTNRMFSGAVLFNQDLCAWRTKLPLDADVEFMFGQTRNSCPTLIPPQLPNGPMCHLCS